MSRHFSFLPCIALFVIGSLQLRAAGPLLLQRPAVSRTDIVFSYAGELWLVPREGGVARMLTSGPGHKGDPFFSPDGTLIAFTADYDGNLDVYVMPSTGGVPQRLTHHPALDRVVGWSPDGKQVLFRSSRNSYSFFDRLFTVPLSGGLPQPLPVPMGESGAFSPEGKRLAYVPVDNFGRFAYIAWKRYRGGKASRIWILNLTDFTVQQLPRDLSNDSNPMWVGGKIYFLSDRNGPTNLFSYDPESKSIEQVLPNSDVDIKSASAGPGAIVYEQLGSLHLFDLASRTSAPVNVTVPADLPEVRPRFRKVADEIVTGRLSPSGVRAVFEAHGEILTVPVDKGSIHNLTNTPGVMERSPAWSPDGATVAYFSDESGEYQLFLKSADGAGEPKRIELGEAPSFYYQPIWSPDSKKIAYTDKRLNLWYLDVGTGLSTKVDTDTYDSQERSLDPAWSPDSSWITYTKRLASHLHAVFVYSPAQSKSFQVTDGLSDARYPVFDQKGKYLYFTASTDVGLTTAWLDLSGIQHPVTRSAYLIVLQNSVSSPLAPEDDEEKLASGSKAGPAMNSGQSAEGSSEAAGNKNRDATGSKPGDDGKVKIDFENIDQRIMALPMEARNYSGLSAGKSGTVFFLEAGSIPSDDVTSSLWRFDLSSRKAEKLLEGVTDFSISSDGSSVLYSKAGQRGRWVVASASMPPAPASAGAETTLRLGNMEVFVNPRAEWRQEYNEIWRIERDFFYDPGLHGVNLRRAREKYEQYLPNLGSRSDFSYLLADMLGELTVGHIAVRTPTDPASGNGKVGLLGADYTIEHDRYKLSCIYKGENWNPELRAPLTQPGVNVREGEYLLAVNGSELRGTDEIFEVFQGLAGKSVTLRVASTAAGGNARDVIVVPIADETRLRNQAWVDGNRRKVDQLSAGQLAYVYLPDTGPTGYAFFNRYFFAQVGRKGAIIDERFNDGGVAPDYIIDYLRRPLQNYWVTREGHDFTTPLGAIFGPKVMITNMFAGSGGDVLPWYFREARLGPLVGTRTWGGAIGVYDVPSLMDGSIVTAPQVAFYTPDGKWSIENSGVQPDHEVDIMPRDWVAGRDPQLEKAVALALDSINKEPQRVVSHPPFPDYQLRLRASEGTRSEAGSTPGTREDQPDSKLVHQRKKN